MKNRMTKPWFKKKIEEIFRGVDSYYEDVDSRTVRFEAINNVTFDMLEQLSKILNTRKIDLNGGEHEGCPTCGGESYVRIDCGDVVYPGTMTEKEKKQRG